MKKDKGPRLARVRPPIGGEEIKPQSLVDIFYPIATTEEKRHQRREEDIKKARQYMQDNLENPFSLEDLAQKMYLHPRQVQRIFHSAGSAGFALEMRSMRLRESRKMLLTLSVLEVSRRLQYKHPSHFAKAFRKEYGKNPKAWQMAELKKERATVR